MPSEHDTHAGARHFCRLAQSMGFAPPAAKGLVAGCGKAHEAAHIHDALGVPIVGVDVRLESVAPHKDGLHLFTATVLDLPFKNESFDFVFYHHVIEHVPDPAASLNEISRVMKTGGWMYIGTPNRHRIVGYVGSYEATFAQKIVWNLNDYAARLRGRFRNEFGAHAGFTKRELRDMLNRNFSEIRWLTGDYLQFKFGARVPQTVLRFLSRPSVLEVAAPAIYALCRK